MRLRTFVVYVVLLATALGPLRGRSAIAQTNQQSGVASGAVQTDPESQINQRNLNSKGIIVGEPKVYDDLLLQQMLQSAQSKLMALQVLDPTGISSHFGAVTGAAQQFSGFGLNIQGPTLPSTVTTANGATGSTQITEAPSGTTTIQSSGLPVTNVQTTQPQMSPPPVTAPAPAASLPTSFNVSASDILNEQMQLVYEITNLSLLLDGSLSDRFLKLRFPGSATNTQFVKARTTLGFPISISPDKRYKDAVAVVEVEIEKLGDLSRKAKTTNADDVADDAAASSNSSSDPCDASSTSSRATNTGEPPRITALLPREKTYNVAKISEHSSSIGGGVATQILGVSSSFLRGRRTYYLVQDQDTLAFTVRPTDGQTLNKAAFLWEFRPVLGEHYVRAGLKQTFVQIAFPRDQGDQCFGNVRVKSYWRRYDAKKRIVGDVIPGSLRVQNDYGDWKIRTFDLVPRPAEIRFELQGLEDLGGGQMQVSLPNRFLPGTAIRVGSAILGQGSPSFSFNRDVLRFVAPISDLATKKVFLVGRDGSEHELVMDINQIPDFGRAISEDLENGIPATPAGKCFGRQLHVWPNDIDIKTVDQTNSIVKVTIRDNKDRCFSDNDKPPLVLVVGNKVFGYSDAPVQRDWAEKNYLLSLTAVVPTSLLIANPQIVVKALFQKRNFKASVNITDKFRAVDANSGYLLSQTERLVVLDQGEKTTKFLLFGNRLDKLEVLQPSGVVPQPIGRPEDASTLRLIELTTAQLKTQKQLVLQRYGERPFSVQIPALDATKDDTPNLKARERVTVGADEVVIEGGGLKDLTKVIYDGKEIPFEPTEDGAIRLKELNARHVTDAQTVRTLIFLIKDKKVPVKLDIVKDKIETVVR